MRDLEDIFGAGGPLEAALADFTVREPQRRMAERIGTAIAWRETLVVEAGTGTGKTFAYLVPALLAGARVLISTGTRTLQDQLYSKDLPLVARALGRPATVAVLKGRANYLCRYRLAQGAAALALPLAAEAPGADTPLERIRRWALTTRTGDLAEVPGLSDADPVWGEVTSTRDNCLGQRCTEFAACHVALARRAIAVPMRSAMRRCGSRTMKSASAASSGPPAPNMSSRSRIVTLYGAHAARTPARARLARNAASPEHPVRIGLCDYGTNQPLSSYF